MTDNTITHDWLDSLTAPLDSVRDKAKLRRFLRQHNVNTQGMADYELIRRARYQLEKTPQTDTDPSTPEGTWVVEDLPPSDPVIITQNATGGTQEPEQPQLPAPTAHTPAPATDLGGLGGTIERAIRDAIATAGASHLNEAKVLELIEKHTHQRWTFEITRPDKIKVEIQDAHEVLPRVIRAAQVSKITRVYPFLVGPMGSGKSTLAEQLADALGVPFYSYGAVHQKYDLLGFVDANGQYHDVACLYECAKNGGVFLLDELDASNPPALPPFNQFLANGVLTFPNGETVQMHPDCYIVAAGNTRGTGANRKYVGRNPIDGATLDRFYKIDVGYDEVLEERLTLESYAKAGGEDQTVPKRWLATVRKFRQQALSNTWAIDVGTRPSMMGAALLAVGESVEDCKEGLLYRALSDDQRRQLGLPTEGK